MNLFEDKKFISHSGKPLSFKIECDALTDEDLATLAKLVAMNITFDLAYGVPNGGCRFAATLNEYRSHNRNDKLLIVDDVLTTGTSMEDTKLMFGDGDDILGIVIFARGPCPNWVIPIFQVNDCLIKGD